MRLEIFRRAFTDAVQPLMRKWAAVIAMFTLLLIAAWPILLRSQSAGSPPAWIHILRIAIGDSGGFLNAADWVNLGGFSLALPALLSLFSIQAGSRLLAWGDENGNLALLLAYPIRRRRILLEKYAALPAGLLALCLILWLACMASALAVKMPLQPGWTALACLNAGLLALVFGTTAFMIGVFTGSGRRGVRFSTLLFLILYLLYRLPDLLPPVAFLKYLSPFTYALLQPRPGRLITGIPWISLALILILLAASWKAFDQRDLEL